MGPKVLVGVGETDGDGLKTMLKVVHHTPASASRNWPGARPIRPSGTRAARSPGCVKGRESERRTFRVGRLPATMAVAAASEFLAPRTPRPKAEPLQDNVLDKYVHGRRGVL